MYHDDLQRESMLIARGYEEYARDFGALWASIRALLSFGSAAHR